MYRLMTALLLVLILIAAVVAAGYWICMRMPGQSWHGALPPPGPDAAVMRKRLEAHVHELSEVIGERNHNLMSRLDRAADYIFGQFEEIGLAPTAQTYSTMNYRNIVVDLYGRERRGEIIVVGAHYDTVYLTRGADDNASGVAALIEIARMLKDVAHDRSIRLVAFANEEWPHFGRDDMGSMVSARHASEQGERVTAMFSLEMLGYYDSAPGSQHYPAPVRPFYPDTGDFIAFVANLRSRPLLHEAITCFRRVAAFPSEGLAAPTWLVPDVRRSDNYAFWYYGFPAIMVTDTSNFRNPHYHLETDRYDTLDFDRLTRVTDGLGKMIADLAGAPD